jgi:hypothetical protein
MKKEFVSYDQSSALKELGFDEPGFGRYHSNNDDLLITHTEKYVMSTGLDRRNFFTHAPLKQQVFRWFREKYNIQGYIYSSTVRGNKEGTKQFTGYVWNINGIDMTFISTDARYELHDTYEEAEDACIDKLIEIVKQNNKK